MDQNLRKTREKALRGVMVVMVVVMVMAGSKSGGAGKHRQKQNYRKNLFHGRHPNRIELVTEAPCCASYQESKEGKTGAGAVRSSGLQSHAPAF
jgi:hypothetical protein